MKAGDKPEICLQLAIQVLMQDVDRSIAKIAQFSEEMAGCVHLTEYSR